MGITNEIWIGPRFFKDSFPCHNSWFCLPAMFPLHCGPLWPHNCVTYCVDTHSDHNTWVTSPTSWLHHCFPPWAPIFIIFFLAEPSPQWFFLYIYTERNYDVVHSLKPQQIRHQTCRIFNPFKSLRFCLSHVSQILLLRLQNIWAMLLPTFTSFLLLPISLDVVFLPDQVPAPVSALSRPPVLRLPPPLLPIVVVMVVVMIMRTKML